MRGSFARSLVLFVVLAVSALAAFSPAEASTGSYLKTIVVKWVEPGQLASTAKDTMFVTDEADTARSTVIDIADIDWEGTLAQTRNTFMMNAAGTNPDSTGPMIVATVEFVATRANNGVTDTLYFNPEQGVANASAGGLPGGSCAACRPDTMFSFNPLGVSSGHGIGTTDALSSGFATVRGPVDVSGRANQNVYRGVLTANPNRRGKNDMWGVKRFRLVSCGDVGGSTPKLSGVMCFLTYLAKRP